ncbi:hypothetical protein QFC19_007114 [Naganishia cerealis]|uniref:Uncharacterized protein n=1 Tax=Naganishia cerealis TaxID=610337 RepID=A0ACC2VCA4_9TREE|nr:hypothetical protein QFC19_007114 [Naganishia cerealis]
MSLQYLIPPWAPEQDLDNDPNIITTRRRIFFPLNAPADSVHVEFSEDVELVPEELSRERQRTGRWVYYKTWEMKPEALEGKEAGGKGVDMVMVHAVYAVLQDVIRVDLRHGKKQREVFLSGASMGGWTILYYLMQVFPVLFHGGFNVLINSFDSPSTYPSTTDVTKIATSGTDGSAESNPKHEEEFRPKIAGAFVMCPLVNDVLSYRPDISFDLPGEAPGLYWIIPPQRLELFVKASGRDYTVDSDRSWGSRPSDIPSGYDDILRSYLKRRQGTENIRRVGIDEADDRKRQAVLADWKAWLLKRVDIDRKAGYNPEAQCRDGAS